MSEIEVLKGTMYLMKSDKSVEDQILALFEKHNIKYMPDIYGSLKEQFEDEFYRDYIIHNGKMYQIASYKIQNIFEAWQDNENIKFTLNFHNGGMSFDEALKEALKSLDSA